MKRKRKSPTPAREWGPWQNCRTDGYTTPGTNREIAPERVVRNNLFTVIITRITPNDPKDPSLLWLSIKRNDRKPIRDWRHMQRIKNELVGPTYEGMEMYPSEDRLVDTANQYHLWVVDDPTFRWPWGYTERMVATPEEAEEVGAKQRPFDLVP